MSERIRRKFLPLQILLIAGLVYAIGAFSDIQPIFKAEAASIIYYTTDGSEIDFGCAGNPGCSTYKTSGSLSLPVTKTTTIRYVAEDEFGNRGFEQVVTYNIGEEEAEEGAPALVTEEFTSTVPTIVETVVEEAPTLAAAPLEEAEEAEEAELELAEVEPETPPEPVVTTRGEMAEDVDFSQFMKRGPLAELIVKIFGFPLSDEVTRESLFRNLELRDRTVYGNFSLNQFYADVPPTHENSPYINELTLQNIVRGRLESGMFEPGNTVNKAEMLAMVLNSSGMFGFDYDFIGKTYEWYDPYILFAQGNNLVPADYDPLETATIGDADKLLYNVLLAKGDAEGETLRAVSDPIEVLKSKLKIKDATALRYDEVVKILLLVRGFNTLDDIGDYEPNRNDLLTLALPSTMLDYGENRAPERHAMLMLLNTMLSKHHVSTVSELLEQRLVPEEYFEDRVNKSNFTKPLRYLNPGEVRRLKNLLFECFGVVAGSGVQRDEMLLDALASTSQYCNTPARADLSYNKRTCLNQCISRLGDNQVSKTRFESEYTSFTDIMGETLKFFPEIVAEFDL